MANNSTNLTGLWSKGSRGTLWGVNLKPEQVRKMIADLQPFADTGADLSLWANEVKDGERKPNMSLKVGPPWKPDANRAPGGERTQYGGASSDAWADVHGSGGDDNVPF